VKLFWEKSNACSRMASYRAWQRWTFGCYGAAGLVHDG
jgi:predicted MarR family transcription regulator